LVVIGRFIATSLTVMWHLHFVLEKKKAGGVSWLTSVCRCLCHLQPFWWLLGRVMWHCHIAVGGCGRPWAFFIVCGRSGGRWGK